ncbi:MAG: TonB-dependent receptor [Bacteroidetes bacterium]|nr:TonB-dependent receptor [Bacteroidota bacterium]MBU1679874.1 TonB-dependent receptor [Bacteroidota bacterium]
MKSKKNTINTIRKFLRLSIIIMAFANIQIYSQSKGVVAGTVVDGSTGELLIGANIIIANTGFGASSDFDGKYLIPKIPAGEYSLSFSMIGYGKLVISKVIVKPDEVTKLDVTMQPESFETEEVVVSAKALENNEAGLLIKRQKSSAVSDAISAEEISRIGIGDAASAMTKVTGASVVGGKYVYIRGLGDRYSATTLNGAELPSADPDKKSFQLDLIPANMLDNINTVKTFTPDKPGTFTGGLVDVNLKSFPEKFSFQASSSVGYNSIATGNSNFILGNSGNYDFFGMDDGTRNMPGILNGGNIDIPRASSIRTKESAISLSNLSSSFNHSMVPVRASAPVNTSLALSFGNTNYLDSGSRIGYFGSFTWNQNYSFIEDGSIGRYKLVGNLNEVTLLQKEFEGTDTKGTRTVDWGTIANITYINADIGEIKFSFMHTQSGESTGRNLVGVRDRDRSSIASTRTFETRSVSWVERSLNNYQLEGKHLLSSLAGITAEWKLTFSENEQLEPDQRYFFNIYDIQPDGTLFYNFDGANSQPISRYFRDLNESNLASQLNITIPFNVWNGLGAKLKTGAALTNVERSYNQKRFDYDTNRMRLNDYHGNIEALFHTVGIVDSVSNPERPERWFGLTIDNESMSDSTNYFRGSSKVKAAYAMVDVPLIKDLRFIGGVRFESANINSWTLDPTDALGLLDNSDFLPSFNLVYNLSANMNLRLAYSNTIARPTFRELAPYQSFEFVGDFLYQGNPNLKRTLVKNYDFRWEWFVNPGEIIAFSSFYKSFTNPIESYIDPRFSDDSIKRSVKNVSSGRVYGIEIELRKGLGFILPELDNLKIGSNFSIVESHVDIPEEDIIEKINNGDINPSKTRPFQGQSPYLLNLNLSYDDYESGTSAGIFYNLFGDRLFLTARFATPDVYEKGYATLDFKASKILCENFKLSLSIKNILDPEHKFTYNLNNDLTDKEFFYSSFRKGISLAMSISYNI